MIICDISRVSLERVNQDPEVPLVHQDLLDLELVTAKYVRTSNTFFFQYLLFQDIVILVIYVLIDVF